MYVDYVTFFVTYINGLIIDIIVSLCCFTHITLLTGTSAIIFLEFNTSTTPQNYASKDLKYW
jgi:hypothetical protein